MSKILVRDFSVKVVRDKDTGKRLSERWLWNGKLHRDDGEPAERIWVPDTGVVSYEAYRSINSPHREDGPCVIVRHPQTGETLGETWAKFGNLGREGDLPALWLKDETTGVVVREEYWLNGVQHRENGPAEIYRDPKTGAVLQMKFYRNGEFLYADDSPAASTLDSDLS